MRPLPHLFGPWAALAVGCCVAMAVLPGEETIPLHVGWVALCLSYGFALWPGRLTVLSILGYALASGAVLLYRAHADVIGWQETAEIPLMACMALVMAMHVARRVDAMDQLAAVAASDRKRLRERELLSRMYSHEMRTPLTIARGYLDLLRGEQLTPQQHSDLGVVDDELATLERVGDRLLRMLAVSDEEGHTSTDVAELLDEVAERWSTVARRRWVVDAPAGVHTCSRERLRMCLDTLVENALRYTDEDDVVRLFALPDGDSVVVGVADSGPGLPKEVLADLNEPAEADEPVPLLVGDAQGGSGLGLALVRQVAGSHDGAVLAGVADEGGAFVALRLPSAGMTTE